MIHTAPLPTVEAAPPAVNGVAKQQQQQQNETSAAPQVPAHSLADICLELRDKVVAFLAEKPTDETLRHVQSQVRVSMGVIDEALARYGPERLSLSYNGGKDCLVLLVLLLAGLPAWATATSTVLEPPPFDTNPIPDTAAGPAPPLPSPQEPSSQRRIPETLRSVYVVCRNPFPEVEDFVESSAVHYHLDLARYALPIRPGLEAYLQEHPEVEAIFVGTRRTDPHGEFLTHFDHTDKNWPQFMRVHPVIDWHYAEIWAFIRHLQIPFCSLYQRGFTSLGSMTDTHPNPALALDGDKTEFRPAYELYDDDKERLGRNH